MIPSRHKSGSAPWGGGSALLCSLHPPQKLQFVLTQKINSSTQFECSEHQTSAHSPEDTHPDSEDAPLPVLPSQPVRCPKGLSTVPSHFSLQLLPSPFSTMESHVIFKLMLCLCFPGLTGRCFSSITQHTRTLNSQASGVGNLILLRCSETLGKVTFFMRLFLYTQHNLLIQALARDT